MTASTRAQRLYVAANLSLAWDCTLLTADHGQYRAERGGQPAAVVEITCLDRPPGQTLALSRITRQALTDAAHELGVKAAMHVWALPEGGTAWAVDVLKLPACPMRDFCYRVPIGAARQITMPVAPWEEERSLWWCESCHGRHELAGMCHAAPSAG